MAAGHILVAVVVGHSPVVEADHILMTAEAGHNLAAEEDIRHIVVRTRLTHHVVLVAGHCNLGQRVHDRLSHLGCHTTSQPHRGVV